MQHNFKKIFIDYFFFVVFCVVFFLCSSIVVQASWIAPTDNPPNGNVSPPVFSSSNALQIIGDAGDGGKLRLYNSDIGNSAELQLMSNANLGTYWSVYPYGGDTSGNLNFSYGTTGSNMFFTIDTSGNIGIGSSTPSNKLSVGGSAYIAGALNVDGSTVLSGGVLSDGNIDLNNNIITNIGNTGTDFNSSGGLTLAGNLDINGTGVSEIAGNLYISGAGTTTIENNLWVKDTLRVGAGSVNITQDSLDFTGPTTLTSGSGDVTIEPAEGGNIVANIGPARNFIVNRKTASSTDAIMYIDSDAGTVNFTGDIDIDGNILLNDVSMGNIDANGLLTQTGNSLFDGIVEVLSTSSPQFKVSFDANNYYNTNVSNTGQVTFNATGTSPNFIFEDDVILGDIADFENNSAMNDLYIRGNLEVDGNIWLGNANIDNITVTGTLTQDGDVDMSNNIISNIGNAETDFTDKGGLNLRGDFAVNTNKFIVASSTGNAVIAGTLSTASTTVSGTLSVASTTTTANLEVTGNTVFNSSLDYLDQLTDGAIIDKVDIVATSSGSNITLSIEKTGGESFLVQMQGNIYSVLPSSIALPEGTDSNPLTYSVYIDENLDLNSRTNGFPSNEVYAPIATAVVQSAASVAQDGVYKLHVWAEHIYNGDNGHLTHINKWIKEQHATWLSGVDPSLSVGSGGWQTSIKVETSQGVISLIHDYSFPAFMQGSKMYVYNHNIPYTVVTDLVQIDQYAGGNTLQDGDRYSLVIWGVVNEDESESKLFINLPSSVYDKNNQALEDPFNYSNYTIPYEYRGTGFLIARITLRYRDSNGGEWQLLNGGFESLLGQVPSIFAGGTGGLTTEFSDSNFLIYDNIDTGKGVKFNVGNVVSDPENPVILTIQNKNGTLAYTEDILSLTGGTMTGNIGMSDGSTIGTSTAIWTFDGVNEDITTLSKIGIGTSSPSQLLVVGNNNQFIVDSSGNVTANSLSGLLNASNLTGSINNSLLDTNLNTIASLSSVDNNFIVGSAGGWVAESGTTARISLGLEIGVDVQAYSTTTSLLGQLIDDNEVADNITVSNYLPLTATTSLPNLLEVGVIATGTWNADIIDIAYGGTGTSSLPASGQALVSNGVDGYNFIAISDFGSGTVNTGSTTQIAYYADNGTTVSGNSNFVVDSGGKVGIGTTSPLFALDVNGDINYTGELRINGEVAIFGDQSYGSESGSLDDSIWVDSNGNVGIGTTDPTSLLHIQGNYSGGADNSIPQMKIINTSTTGGFAFIKTMMGTGYSGGYPELWIQATGGTTGTIGIRGIGNHDMNFFTSNSERMRIDKDGNVGIGTTGPNAALDVAGDGVINVYGASADRGLWQTKNSGGGYETMRFAGNDVSFWTATTDGDSAAAERVTIKNTSGNVGIGTTGPSKKLHVLSSTVPNAHYFSETVIVAERLDGVFQMVSEDGGAYAGAVILTAAPSSGNNKHWGMVAKAVGDSNKLNFAYTTTAATERSFADFSGGEVLTLQTNGNVGIGTTAPGYKLDVNGNSRITGDLTVTGTSYLGNIVLNADNITTKQVTATNSEGLKLFEDGGTGIFIKDGGNVGIGTTNPTSELDVRGTGSMELLELGIGVASMVIQPDATSKDLSIKTTTGGSANLFIESDNGNVGIGTTTPGAKLDINGTALSKTLIVSDDYTGTVNEPNFSITDVNSDGTYDLVSQLYGNATAESRPITFRTSSIATGRIEAMRIASNGNVGIGTTTPDVSLQVSKATDPNIKIQSSTDDGQLMLGYNTTGDYGAFSTKDGGTWYGNTMTLKGGNVGIGTTAPTSPLHVRVGTDENIRLSTIGGGDTRISALNDAASVTTQLSIQGSPLLFRTDGGVEHVRITSTGNVGIGTTAPPFRLSVLGDTSARFGVHTSDYAGSNGSVFAVVMGAATGNTFSELRALSAGGGAWNNLVLQKGGGNVGIGTTGPLFALDVNGDINYTGELRINGEVAIFGDQSYGSESGSLDDSIWVDSNGNVGIGTTNPDSVLSVNQTSSTTPLVNIKQSDGNTALYINAYGQIAIGTTTPLSQFYVNGDARIDGALDMNGNNIGAINKLTVTTIDPLYDIDGIKYSTYAPSFAGGVKEEVVGNIKLKFNNDYMYEGIIDFNNLEEGSDLWLFFKVVDFGKDWENLVVNSTASFEGKIWYEKDIQNNRLIIYGSSLKSLDAVLEASYRLTANRIDWSKWPNLAPDQNEKAGINITTNE